LSGDAAPVRVVLAEDSAVTRALLTAILREAPGFQLVAAVNDGDAAVKAVIRHRPSVVAMDLHMPGMNGAQATRQIMQAAPTPIVIVTASANLDGSLMYDALAAGALSVVPRPLGPTDPGHAARRKALLNELRLMSDVRVVRRIESPTMHMPPAVTALTGALQSPPASAPQVIAIGASTGGPAALLAVLKGLPSDLDLPIVIVQHIADGFVEGLATWLSRETKRTVVVGQEGMVLRRGLVVLAPDDRHLRITSDGAVRLGEDRAVAGHRPSATVLFESVAAAYGPAAIGVTLTGMGRDGADGLLKLIRAGGISIVQSPRSSAVSGMPGAAIEVGAADHVVDLGEIGTLLAVLVAAGRRRATRNVR
jgi:two-component system chemotaxis response regulator CheB